MGIVMVNNHNGVLNGVKKVFKKVNILIEDLKRIHEEGL